MPLTMGVCELVRQRVRQRHAHAADLAHLHDPRKVFEVDLVDDSHAGRDDAEVLERLLRPAEQRVPLAVALVLAGDVALVRLAVPEGVHLHRVIDDEVDRHERVDAHRVAAFAGDRGAHGCQVDDRRDTGEVLEEDPRRHERALAIGSGDGPVPARDRLHVALTDPGCAGVAHAVLEENLQGHREPRDVTDAPVGERAEAVVGNPRQQFRRGAVGVDASHTQAIFASGDGARRRPQGAVRASNVKQSD